MAKKDILSVLPKVHDLKMEDSIKTADLAWQVQQEKIGGMETGREVVGRKALFTSDDRFLGDVGENYSPSNPKDFVSELYSLAEFAGFPVGRLGFVESRSQMVGLIDCKPISINNDRLNVGIMVSDGFDGFTALNYKAIIIREICSNGMVSKSILNTARAKHSLNFETKKEKLFKHICDNMQNWLNRLEEKFIKLHKTPFDQKKMGDLMEKLFPLDEDGERSTRSQNIAEQISFLFGSGTGNSGKTAWDALNAFTEYETHFKSYKNTQGNSSEVNQFTAFSNGKLITDKVLALL